MERVEIGTRPRSGRATRSAAVAAAVIFGMVVVGRDGHVAARPRTSATLAIVNATVVPMDSERALPRQTLIVEGDRIAAMGPPEAIALPEGSTPIDAAGWFVTPGLIDMHVHIREQDLAAYIANGVTSVRNMWGYAALPGIMRRIAAGELVGPAIYSASPGLDGPPAAWPETQLIEDPNRADALVAAQIQAGWRFIKVYQSLKPAVYDAIVQSARARGIRVVGHVATDVTIEHALASGQASIEHLRGYDLALTRRPGRPADLDTWTDIDRSRLSDLVARTVAAGAWNCPTLAIWEVFTRSMAAADRQRVLTNRADVVRALSDGGARLLAGTDSGIDQTAAGSSIHDELEDLVGAGLTPFEALAAATSAAAEFLDETSEIGTIAPGRRADLIFSRRDPLEDVRALRSPGAVLMRGVWVVGPSLSPRAPSPPAAPPARSPRVVPRSA